MAAQSLNNAAAAGSRPSASPPVWRWESGTAMIGMQGTGRRTTMSSPGARSPRYRFWRKSNVGVSTSVRKTSVRDVDSIITQGRSSRSKLLQGRGAPAAASVEGGNENVATEPHSQDLGESVEIPLPSQEYKQEWDAVTARVADAATLAFLMLQLPQIVLNAQNLVSGNVVALTAIPWMGQLTGLLGNLSLLSYFAGKKERGATVVQAVGVVTTGVVLSQLALGGAMPLPVAAATASVVAVGLLLNWLSYFNRLSPHVWALWGDCVTVGGLTVLPQVMWSTFEPFIPPSLLPAAGFGATAVLLVVLARLGKLPPRALKFYSGLSGWTATLLFMWGPVAQAWANYVNPGNIKGLSVLTVLLAMAGNGLLLPRALFTRDLMWFTGSSWGTLLQGWGILVTMFIFHVVNDTAFYGISATLALYLGWMIVNDAKAYSLESPFASLLELVTGTLGSVVGGSCMQHSFMKLRHETHKHHSSEMSSKIECPRQWVQAVEG